MISNVFSLLTHLLLAFVHLFRTSLAIAGKDFCVVASDTRQSTGYSINSRYAPKAYELGDNAVIAMNGFHADGLTLKKVLEQRLKVKKKKENIPIQISIFSLLPKRHR